MRLIAVVDRLLACRSLDSSVLHCLDPSGSQQGGQNPAWGLPASADVTLGTVAVTDRAGGWQAQAALPRRRFSRHDWGLAASVWFLQGSVGESFKLLHFLHSLFSTSPTLFNPHPHFSLPLHFLKCRKRRIWVHLKPGVVGDVPPHKDRSHLLWTVLTLGNMEVEQQIKPFKCSLQSHNKLRYFSPSSMLQPLCVCAVFSSRLLLSLTVGHKMVRTLHQTFLLLPARHSYLLAAVSVLVWLGVGPFLTFPTLMTSSKKQGSFVYIHITQCYDFTPFPSTLLGFIWSYHIYILIILV